MARNKLHADSWVAQVHIAGSEGVPAPRIQNLVTGFDRILRRATSVKRFVLRVHTIPDRRETIALIAATRHTRTDRADSAVLSLLRRGVPSAEKGVWARVAEATTPHVVFVDYRLVDAEECDAEAVRLKDNSYFHNGSQLTTSTDPPVAS